MKKLTSILLSSLFLPVYAETPTEKKAEEMDKLWGKDTVKLRAKDATRGQLFDEGNYAMFIHWGLYSQLGNHYKGKNYYGIGEWIKHSRMADIPNEEYVKLAEEFNPSEFNAEEIVTLAKEAGMKYIVITSKHHDGFAMYDSAVGDFDIKDNTPWGKDPMKELSEECEKQGLGFGFYYSHNQDWIYPGAGNGPETDAEGNPKTFEDYFKEKCLPQVEEITSKYGKIEIVWFDTPGNMPKEYVEQLVEVVRKNQPDALISGRAGHDLGDYRTLGDMEVPNKNVEGMWESVDTTNDSWAYAWYDEHWKSPKEILKRLIACVGRGGTYMFNIGPDGKGAIPQRAKDILTESGKWIKKYPQVIYNTDASPWGHPLSWGDATVKENIIFLTVFDWPQNGELYLTGLKNTVTAAQLYTKDGLEELSYESTDNHILINVPASAPEKLISVIELTVEGTLEADQTHALNPEEKTTILSEFGHPIGEVSHKQRRWMEKFGEWKAAEQFSDWGEGAKAEFEVNVIKPGDYNVSLTYTGEERLVWGIEVLEGEKIQNQQNASHNYQEFPIGWVHFDKPGKQKIQVSLLEGSRKGVSLKALHLEPMILAQ